MFQPVIPLDGVAGWRFLNRTYDTQLETFAASNEIKRDTDYFVEQISEISSAEDLVSDFRLLTVALGAFGLQDDINNRFFIQKILEEGTTAPDALANQFTDPRYKEFSEAFGLGPGDFNRTVLSDFTSNIISRYEANSFEVAAGNQNGSMRIALYAERTLPELAASSDSTNAKWFSIMGDPPMREFMEKALNLPAGIGQVDIDQQLELFKESAREVFGSDDLSAFTEDDAIQDAITRFVVRDQISQFSSAATSPGAVALTLLQNI